MNDPQPRQLGQVLIARGVISEDQLRIALLEQMKSDLPVGKLLVSLGFVSEATLRDALSESLGRQSIDLSRAIIDPAALSLVPRELAKRHHLLPLDYDEDHRRLTIAASDVNDIVAFDRIRALAARPIEIDALLAGETEIERAIDQASATNCRSTESCTRSRPAKSIPAACSRRPANTASPSSA
jgi:general secretion pathway protein E/type IV pilus assembly protein PilB